MALRIVIRESGRVLCSANYLRREVSVADHEIRPAHENVAFSDLKKISAVAPARNVKKHIGVPALEAFRSHRKR
jgi:hypothetical protein